MGNFVNFQLLIPQMLSSCFAQRTKLNEHNVFIIIVINDEFTFLYRRSPEPEDEIDGVRLQPTTNQENARHLNVNGQLSSTLLDVHVPHPGDHTYLKLEGEEETDFGGGHTNGNHAHCNESQARQTKNRFATVASLAALYTYQIPETFFECRFIKI